MAPGVGPGRPARTPTSSGSLRPVYETNESWAKAIACWEQVKKINPNDQDANRKINALSAASTIKRSGLERGDRQARGKTAAKERPPSSRSSSSREAHARGAPDQGDQGGPGRHRSYLKLADNYKMRGELDKAEKVLA